ncbi:primase-like DNA-binding domain-containing protein [Microbacterium forte]|uniref:primase-like DNA-binding domain-containing protein n=1 Tax=Microbacterium forte TaxID=2982533 RepID=UPI0028932AA2|nr:primase-like DNA-binding domain-containing protein [Microbacterium sp. A(2022)]
MRNVDDNLTTAISELQCVQTGTPATIDELNAIRIARDRIELLLRSCVTELREHPTLPASWKDISTALDSDSAHAVRKRFSTTLAVELEQAERFWGEYGTRFVWDLLPNGFLYALYRSWLVNALPGHAGLSKETFMRRLLTVVQESGGWEHVRVRAGDRMRSPEPLLKLFTTWSPSSIEGRAVWGFKRILGGTAESSPRRISEIHDRSQESRHQ